MHIKSVDIQNFRKLASIRIDFSRTTTLLVGANNSGKTSALVAMKTFLIDGAPGFNITDVTLSNWSVLNEIGAAWDTPDEHEGEALESSALNSIMPILDLWLGVRDDEVHRVGALLPSLSWPGDLLGVRVALVVKDVTELYREYRTERRRNLDVTEAAASKNKEDDRAARPVELWPSSLTDFLARRMNKHFELRYYVLDSAERGDTVSLAHPPQQIPERSISLTENPIRSLVQIDLITAQRGFSDPATKSSPAEALAGRNDSGRLSRQLSGYYKTHLDPNAMPDVKDLEAISVISEAQHQFDQRLHTAFSEALAEMEGLGYPGVSDPKIRVSSKLNAEQSLAHQSAVSFRIDVDGDEVEELHLPEAHNGLGYQNLISMVFQLMSFRDKWIRIGKEGLREHARDIEPIHLVLVEEPEAHLHVQVQQVFARKAYEVLRNRPELKDGETLSTQLVMSTHSSHVSHELPFAKLRYFRRLPAGAECKVPTSNVISLSTVFGTEDETDRFVSRYLRAHHSDLFFADAVIIVEGNAERMLLPNFIHETDSLSDLNSTFVTILEINGSHSHRLKNLIQALQIPTLVITDLDPTTDGKRHAVEPGSRQLTSNPTLTKWAAFNPSVDSLLSLEGSDKVQGGTDPLFKVRFAYQNKIEVSKDYAGGPVYVYPTTFEDALALENPEFFADLKGSGLTASFREAFEGTESKPGIETAKKLFDALGKGVKSELILDVLAADNFSDLQIPSYIYEGLLWLQESVSKRLDPLSQVVSLTVGSDETNA
ncbi:AAA family ATPase [Kocuria indica]|uniref:AAA family ATPase n=1 Tax=Kocuria marina TaxID=223184 RepID=UPI001EF5B582|nr:AAA family ATPase [Kocuria indica]MCG7432546.1 AAA family ATPase [Kocuria indica]